MKRIKEIKDNSCFVENRNKCCDCIHYKNGNDLMSILNRLEIKVADSKGSWVRCAKDNTVKANTNACFRYWGVKQVETGQTRYKRKRRSNNHLVS